MNKMFFIIILCIVGIVQVTNAQQRVNREEVKNAAINTLYDKADVLKRLSDTEIGFVNNKNDVLTLRNK